MYLDELSTPERGSQQQPTYGGRQQAGGRRRRKGKEYGRPPSGRGPAESSEPRDRYTLTPATPQHGAESMQQPGRYIPQQEPPRSSGGREGAQKRTTSQAGATPHGPPRTQPPESAGGLPSRDLPPSGKVFFLKFVMYNCTCVLYIHVCLYMNCSVFVGAIQVQEKAGHFLGGQVLVVRADLFS